MADDELPEDVEEDDVDDEDFDEDGPDLDEELVDLDEAVEDISDDDEKEEDDDEDDDVETPAPKRAASDDDDDDDVDPSDVEADLDEILRDRIAANDDDDDDDEDEVKPPQAKTAKTTVAPKRSDEWTCTQCFLIVSSSQFGTKDDPRCPSGEDPCASVKRALG